LFKIKATYDGNHFKFEKPLPKGKYNVELRFTESNESNEDMINEILELSGVWNEKDVDLFDKIMKERKNFSSERIEL